MKKLFVYMYYGGMKFFNWCNNLQTNRWIELLLIPVILIVAILMFTGMSVVGFTMKLMEVIVGSDNFDITEEPIYEKIEQFNKTLCCERNQEEELNIDNLCEGCKG